MIANDAAKEFFAQWRACSIKMMEVLCPQCPTEPKGKYRHWADGEGPIGIIHHYTGGPDGIASLRWSNENPANTSSSWHVTVLDSRLTDVDAILDKYPIVKQYLPVTALLHADIERGTWHGNWANSKCFGIENRNVGRVVEHAGEFGKHFKRKDGTTGFRPLKDQKRAVLIEGAWWESFTVEQLVANINIGKMLAAWRGSKFDKRWVLPHQFVWATKSDTGLAFPMYWVREAIFDSAPVEEIDWLQKYPASEVGSFAEVCTNAESARHQVQVDDRSAGNTDLWRPTHPTDFDKIDGVGWRDYLPAVRENLTILGGYCNPPEDADESLLDADLQLATEIFQHSTYAKWRGLRNLKTDGIPGKITRSAIEYRLKQFGYEV